MKRLILFLAATTALGGCTLDPAYRRPDAPVPPAFPQGPSYPPAAAAPPAANLAWRAFFLEPKLRAVVELALAQNRDLRAAVANIQTARAQVAITRSSLFPAVNGSGGELYQRSPNGVGGSIDERFYTATLGVSNWEIDLFGRIRSQTRAAQEQYLASEEARRAVQTSLIAEAASDWFALAADRQLLAVARRTLEAQQSSLDLVRSRFNAGVASELEVQQAETTVAQARSDVAQFTTDAAQARNALDLVVGSPVDDSLLPTGLETTAGQVADLKAGTTSQVLLQRPDVLEAEHQLKAANADIGAARAAFFPSVSLTGNAGQESDALSHLFDAASRSWLFQPSVSLPIFAGGRNVGGLRSAKASRDAAVAQYDKAIQTAFRETADALARQGTIDEQLAAQQALVDASDGSFKLSTARYERGADTYLNVLVAERALYSAQQSQVQTQLVALTNAVTLYKALGGGVS